jgi:hypothetical protein
MKKNKIKKHLKIFKIYIKNRFKIYNKQILKDKKCIKIKFFHSKNHSQT